MCEQQTLGPQQDLPSRIAGRHPRIFPVVNRVGRVCGGHSFCVCSIYRHHLFLLRRAGRISALQPVRTTRGWTKPPCLTAAGSCVARRALARQRRAQDSQQTRGNVWRIVAGGMAARRRWRPPPPPHPTHRTTHTHTPSFMACSGA